jgi:hypothetical protein
MSGGGGVLLVSFSTECGHPTEGVNNYYALLLFPKAIICIVEAEICCIPMICISYLTFQSMAIKTNVSYMLENLGSWTFHIGD